MSTSGHDGVDFEKMWRREIIRRLWIRVVMLTSLLPWNEILIDFHDRIKSIYSWLRVAWITNTPATASPTW